MALGDAHGGIDIAQQSVEQNPTSGFGWLSLSVSQMLAGENLRAIELFAEGPGDRAVLALPAMVGPLSLHRLRLVRQAQSRHRGGRGGGPRRAAFPAGAPAPDRALRDGRAIDQALPRRSSAEDRARLHARPLRERRQLPGADPAHEGHAGAGQGAALTRARGRRRAVRGLCPRAPGVFPPRTKGAARVYPGAIPRRGCRGRADDAEIGIGSGDRAEALAHPGLGQLARDCEERVGIVFVRRDRRHRRSRARRRRGRGRATARRRCRRNAARDSRSAWRARRAPRGSPRRR